MKDPKEKTIQNKIIKDKASLYMYSRSASIFAEVPEGVFFPKNREDVQAIIQYAQKEGKHLTFKGAGTSRSGQDVNSGIIVDMTKHMDQILHFDEAKQELTVEPGITLKKVNQYLKEKGLFFPPDPSSGDYCTLGGMCANNSGGARALKYGVTRDYINALEVVLDDGQVYALPQDQSHPRFQTLKTILKQKKQEIEKYYPKTVKNSSGYNLKDLFQDKDANHLHKLFVSSEGTLAAITTITLQAIPIPTFEKGLVLKARDIHAVIDLVGKLKQKSPEKIELLDKDIFQLSGIRNPLIDKILSSDFQYILLLSFSSTSEADQLKWEAIEAEYQDAIIETQTKEEFNQLFKLRKTAAGYIHKQRKKEKPIPVIEDLQVDFSRFHMFKSGIQNILDRFQVKAFFFGHIGDGNIHINTFFDVRKPKDLDVALRLKKEAHRFVIDLGGSLSGEHGDGKLRSSDLPLLYPELYPLFKEIKKELDPNNLFNPNNMIVTHKNNPFDTLRLKPYSILDDPKLHQDERLKTINNHFYISEIEACNGCGKCRDYCPSFKANNQDERYTTRARLTLFQGLSNGDFLLDDFYHNIHIKETINSCIGCHICASECPTGVDAGKLIFKLKEVLEEEYSFIDSFIKDNPKIGKLGQKTAKLSNALLKTKAVKKLNQKLLGFSSSIELPAFQKLPFSLDNYRYSLDHLPKNPVVYYVGCFAHYYHTDTELLPTIRTLEALDYNPVLLDFECCGITKINQGMSVKKEANHNMELFKQLIDKQITLVTTSPSCLHTLVDLYPFLHRSWAELPLKDYMMDIFTFLRKKEKMLSDFKHDIQNTPIQYHPPCHTRQTSISTDIQHVLSYLGYSVTMLPESCCGMAGTFGLYENNQEKSKKIGGSQMARIDKIAEPVITSCGTCQIQINNKTKQKATHPIHYVWQVIKNH